MHIEPPPDKALSKKVKPMSAPELLIVARALTVVIDLFVLISLITNLNYRHEQVAAATVRLTVPAMSGDKYISLFETHNTKSSNTVARLLTDFGLRDDYRPPIEIRYNEFMYTTNQSFDNGWTETHSRGSNSTCYVMLMAGLDPEMKDSIASVYRKYIGTDTLVNLKDCTGTKLRLGQTTGFYDITLVVWVIEFCLLFQLNLMTILFSFKKPFSKSACIYYMSFWIFTCGACTIGYLVCYIRYLAGAMHFAPEETASINAPASTFAQLGAKAAALHISNKMASARPLLWLFVYVIFAAVIVPFLWLCAAFLTPEEPTLTNDDTQTYSEEDLEMKPICRIDSAASSILSADSLIESKDKETVALMSEDSQSWSSPPEYMAPPQYPGH